MHRHKTLDDLFEVFPFFLSRVVVAVCINLRRQMLELNLHMSLLDGLNCDLFSCCAVSDYDNALIKSHLLLVHDVSWFLALQLLLCLIE